MNSLTKYFLVVFSLFVFKVSAQDSFPEKAFEAYPVDSIIELFKRNNKLLNKVYKDTLREPGLFDSSHSRSSVSLYITAYSKNDDNVKRFKCTVDLEFYYANDSLLAESYKAMIARVGEGKKFTSVLTSGQKDKSHRVSGMHYTESNVVIGIKTSGQKHNLIFRKESMFEYEIK